MAQPLINPMNFEPRADLHVGSGSYCPPARTWEAQDLTGLTAGYVLIYGRNFVQGSVGIPSCYPHRLQAGLAFDQDLNCVLEPRLLLAVQPAAVAPDYGNMLNEMKSALDVTLSYVARSLGLQRSAVYKWYQGAIPHAANRSRIEALREFARAWRVARLPSLKGYWDVRVPGGQATLGDLLSGPKLDLSLLRSTIRALAAEPAAGRRPRLGFPDRKRDRTKDREWLEASLPSTSREDEG